MAEDDSLEAQRRLQTQMKDMIEDLDKTRIRKIQRQMHECSAKCCQNDNAGMEQTQRCIAECSAPVQAAHNYVQQEFVGFQERIQRCFAECQDRAKDTIGANDPSEAELNKFKKDFEGCAIRCVNENLKLAPDLVKKMKKVLDKHM